CNFSGSEWKIMENAFQKCFNKCCCKLSQQCKSVQAPTRCINTTGSSVSFFPLSLMRRDKCQRGREASNRRGCSMPHESQFVSNPKSLAELENRNALSV
ncbi:unnamed protein product, partial [Durusdinium trenchii]